MKLSNGTPAEISAVLERTHALWADGLDSAAYQEYIRTLMASDWAREGEGNYRFLVLREDAGGPPCGGMKLYRFDARLDGEPVSCGGVGAVFVFPEVRRRGLATRMLEEAHRIMRARGDALSLLFSEIGAGYYARRGYRELPRRDVAISVPEAGAEPPAVSRMHRSEVGIPMRLREIEDEKAPFALRRSAAGWKFLLARASFPTLALGRERWESRLMLAGRAGYLWALFGEAHDAGGAKLLELGEECPGAAAGSLLDDLFAECRRRGVASIEAWLTADAAARDPRLAGPLVTRDARAGAIPMWRALDPAVAPRLEAIASSTVFHLTDLF